MIFDRIAKGGRNLGTAENGLMGLRLAPVENDPERIPRRSDLGANIGRVSLPRTSPAPFIWDH
jgi:hypothetical protein